jgi:A/G-specific adenine glycosylase
MPLPRKSQRDRFVNAVWHQYRTAGRNDLPWRKTRDPYRILVSEIMLQQTQAERVRGYFKSFLEKFPSVEALAAAPVADVLVAWQGLGYNRRALALQRIAREVVESHGGKIPRGEEKLRALPGVGPYTLGAVRAFAWNKPGVLLETNVRAVYIHHFFKDREAVTDRELVPIIEATADQENAREWWWAVMDYGAFLKATTGNATRRSAAYAKHKKFAGSDRQLRGRIITLLASKPRTFAQIREATGEPAERVKTLLKKLTAEGFLTYNARKYALAR